MSQNHRPNTPAIARLCGIVTTWTFVWLAAWTLAPILLGWMPVVITSGSMDPAIQVGDVVVARPHSGEGIAPGTVVVFDNGDGRGFITHRVLDVLPDGGYVTQGDASPVPESTPLRADQIVGVATLRVPFVGLPMVWLHSGQWAYLALVIVFLALSLALGRRSIRPFPLPSFSSDGTRQTTTRAGVLLVLLVVLGAVAFEPARAAFANSTSNTANWMTAWNQVRDVAIDSLDLPATARINDTVEITAVVVNVGATAETFDVIADDATQSKHIGTVSVSLDPGEGTIVAFTWEPGGPPGGRTVTVHADLPEDDDPTNNHATATITITAGPPGRP